MNNILNEAKSLFAEMNRLHDRYLLSGKVDDAWFEPGMMEYLDKSDGCYDSETGEMTLRFEAKGTRYEGRTEIAEKLSIGNIITVERDKENPYNSNNFRLICKENNVGNMPATICNALAPLYDNGKAGIIHCFVSYVEPISKRSRYAKQAMIFVELKIRLNCSL